MVKDYVSIRAKLIEEIKSHSVREAGKDAEAVGFLARTAGGDEIIARVPLNNHAADRSTGFFVEPWEQYRAETKLEDEGYVVAGVYHSHPHSEALPSATDKAMARPQELVVIYSVLYDELTVWVEQDGDLVPVELK